jgi:hypothetical protein
VLQFKHPTEVQISHKPKLFITYPCSVSQEVQAVKLDVQARHPTKLHAWHSPVVELTWYPFEVSQVLHMFIFKHRRQFAIGQSMHMFVTES